jgi:hypothetical protein
MSGETHVYQIIEQLQFDLNRGIYNVTDSEDNKIQKYQKIETKFRTVYMDLKKILSEPTCTPKLKTKEINDLHLTIAYLIQDPAKLFVKKNRQPEPPRYQGPGEPPEYLERPPPYMPAPSAPPALPYEYRSSARPETKYKFTPSAPPEPSNEIYFPPLPIYNNDNNNLNHDVIITPPAPPGFEGSNYIEFNPNNLPPLYQAPEPPSENNNNNGPMGFNEEPNNEFPNNEFPNNEFPKFGGSYKKNTKKLKSRKLTKKLKSRKVSKKLKSKKKH